MNRTVASLRQAGLSTIGPSEGARRTAAGGLLRWQTLGVESSFRSGEIDPLPFWIEWARDSTHPAANAPAGCLLEDLQFEHPRAEELRAAFRAMGLMANVKAANQVRILALLQTSKGNLELA
jgi:hypothetical protein